jgi:hypothetical protein
MWSTGIDPSLVTVLQKRCTGREDMDSSLRAGIIPAEVQMVEADAIYSNIVKQDTDGSVLLPARARF